MRRQTELERTFRGMFSFMLGTNFGEIFYNIHLSFNVPLLTPCGLKYRNMSEGTENKPVFKKKNITRHQ